VAVGGVVAAKLANGFEPADEARAVSFIGEVKRVVVVVAVIDCDGDGDSIELSGGVDKRSSCDSDNGELAVVVVVVVMISY